MKCLRADQKSHIITSLCLHNMSVAKGLFLSKYLIFTVWKGNFHELEKIHVLWKGRAISHSTLTLQSGQAVQFLVSLFSWFYGLINQLIPLSLTCSLFSFCIF